MKPDDMDGSIPIGDEQAPAPTPALYAALDAARAERAALVAERDALAAALRVMVGWESAGLYEADAIRSFDRARGGDMRQSELCDAILDTARAALAALEGRT